jgi:hypothetical protein
LRTPLRIVGVSWTAEKFRVASNHRSGPRCPNFALGVPRDIKRYDGG